MHELIKHNGSEWASLGDIRNFETPPDLSENKGKWVPRIVGDEQNHDADTENIDSVTTITESQVLVSYEVTAKTPEELEAVVAARKPPKIQLLKDEGLRRIQLVMPALNDWDALDLAREQFLSIAPSARQPTDNFQTVIDVFQAGKTAASNINAMTDIAIIDAYDVTLDVGWP